MDHPDYLEHQEGPDGQFCDLLTRIPYENQRLLETRLQSARTIRDQQDAALRSLLWTEHHEPHVKDGLTGEWVSDIGKASAEVIVPWRERAMELYNEWYAVAFPGPKGSSRTASQTRRSGKTPKASETSAAS